MKKILSIILAATLSFSMATIAFAADAKITKINLPIDSNFSFDGEAKTGKELKFPLTANMFEWSDGTKPANDTPVTTARLNASSVTIKTSNVDSTVIEKIELLNSRQGNFTVAGGKPTAYVRVKFVDKYVSTSSKDFKTTIYLSLKTPDQKNLN